MRQSRVLLCALIALCCPSLTKARCACGAQLTGSAYNGFSNFFDNSMAGKSKTWRAGKRQQEAVWTDVHIGAELEELSDGCQSLTPLQLGTGPLR